MYHIVGVGGGLWWVSGGGLQAATSACLVVCGVLEMVMSSTGRGLPLSLEPDKDYKEVASCRLDCEAFLGMEGVVLDVRSPGEYASGHIPGAVSFPLFSDEERRQVGITYKHEGREEAMALGLAFVRPKLDAMVARAQALVEGQGGRLRLHCWRGGMRSLNMAWLLKRAGLQVWVLAGGYKAFRRWVHGALAQHKPILALGGLTGVGKTEILKCLIRRGEPVVELEGLAAHAGSAFGAIGQEEQPTTQHFENRVASVWSRWDGQEPIWIEAEGRRLGRCHMPSVLFKQLRAAPVVLIRRSLEERVTFLLQHYGSEVSEELIAGVKNIRKRLGTARAAEAIGHIEAGRLADAVRCVLHHYDRAYEYDLERRDVATIEVEGYGHTWSEIAERLQDQKTHLWTQLTT